MPALVNIYSGYILIIPTFFFNQRACLSTQIVKAVHMNQGILPMPTQSDFSLAQNSQFKIQIIVS
jgi:hypothetical protein